MVWLHRDTAKWILLGWWILQWRVPPLLFLAAAGIEGPAVFVLQALMLALLVGIGRRVRLPEGRADSFLFGAFLASAFVPVATALIAPAPLVDKQPLGMLLLGTLASGCLSVVWLAIALMAARGRLRDEQQQGPWIVLHRSALWLILAVAVVGGVVGAFLVMPPAAIHDALGPPRWLQLVAVYGYMTYTPAIVPLLMMVKWQDPLRSADAHEPALQTATPTGTT